ncbi:MAG: lysophospholipid acyltransferase family protein [Spirochaetota bacterium]|jgi:KDO2-lipid IV(A) lauroyltransferase|nr:lysophospholipid acyltransferase family protein [Spirochaetota bacterium]
MAKSAFVELMEYLPARCVMGCLGRLPFHYATRAGAAFGRFVWRVSPAQRRVTHANIRLAYDNALDKKARARLGRASFENMGKTIFEFMQFPRLSAADILRRTRLVNIEFMDRALAKGRGVIVATLHLSNWEFFAAAYTASGGRLAVVARPLDNTRLERRVRAFREAKGMEVIARGAALRSGLKALRQGKVLAFLMDQNAARHGVFVPFFGRPAATAAGPAALAIRLKIPLVFCYARRDACSGTDDSFSLVFHEECSLPEGGSEEEQIRDLTAHLNSCIEDVVRAYPGQWLWMHPRWRTQQEEK